MKFKRSEIDKIAQKGTGSETSETVLSEITLEAPAADQALVVAVVCNHDAVSSFAVRRSLGPENRCQYQRALFFPPAFEGLNDALGTHWK